MWTILTIFVITFSAFAFPQTHFASCYSRDILNMISDGMLCSVCVHVF